MDAYQLIDITMSISNRIDLHWGLFITVHMALLGAIIYIDRPLVGAEKIGAIVMYSGFAIVNYMLMLTQVEMVGATYADIAALASLPGYENVHIVQQMATAAEQGRSEQSRLVVMFAHGFMLVVVLLSIIFDDQITPIKAEKKRAVLRQKPKEARQPDQEP